MRTLVLVLLCLPSLAFAQPADNQPADNHPPAAGPSGTSAVATPPVAAGSASENGLTSAYGEAQQAPPAAPAELGQRRYFHLVDAWRLEPGAYRAELVYQTQPRYALTDQVVLARLVVGLTQHFQLSMAEALIKLEEGGAALEGTPIALRYTLGRALGDVPGNPAVELEWHPRNHAPSRAAVRLLAGEEVAHLLVAGSVYVEQNVERATLFGVDGSFGAGLGASYPVIAGHLRAGGEARLGMTQDGRFAYNPLVEGGPTMVGTFGPFTVTASLFGNFSRPTLAFEPRATVGYSF